MAITAPTANAVVAGSVNVQLTAADNVGLSRIELRVDNTLVGTYPGTTRAITWDSRSIADGAQTLAVRAVDGAGNSRDATVAVTVQLRSANVTVTK